jgi:D-amino-acid dehydrogenase
MKRHVIVIGAGAIGVVSAIEALRAGFQVTVVDPGRPGDSQSASFGNAGWLSTHSVIPPADRTTLVKVPYYLLDPLGPLSLRPTYLPRITPWLVRYALSAITPSRIESTAKALRPLLLDAPALHQALASEAGLSHLVRPDSGLMHVYRSKTAFEQDSLAWDIRRRLGIEWRELSGNELHKHQPFLTADYDFAVLVPAGGHCVDPGAYVSGLAEYARQQGATFINGKARGFRLEGDRLAAVVLEGGEIPCDDAVIAAGAFSRDLARAVGTDVPLESERGYHAVVEGAQIGPTTPIMVSDRKLVVTMMDRGLRIAGQVELAGLDAAPNWRRADALKKLLYRLFPDLPPETAVRRADYWMGHRPSSPDGRPYIGYATTTRNVILSFGHGHVGLSGSARTGRIVAQLLARRDTEIPIEPFSPRRFGRHAG